MSDNRLDYNEEELLDAIRYQASRDSQFKKKVERAIQAGDDKRLQQLIDQTAFAVFGVVLTQVIEMVKNYISGGNKLF
ncbi:MAG: hypothetical protein AAF821_03445 [Cyanobacteria bacterium P01_D01_bin.156]